MTSARTKKAPRLAALALLASLVPLPTVAGPPEGVSGRMAFDEVADGLRRYRKETDPDERVEWLSRLTPSSDPRVLIALGEALNDPDRDVACSAVVLLDARDSHDQKVWPYTPERRKAVTAWWKGNEADLRRRAKELPR
jgi:hypothetical protein